MLWMIGLIGGIVIGGLLWGHEAAIILGFVGWLGGLIIGSRKKAKALSAPAVAPVSIALLCIISGTLITQRDLFPRCVQ